jgi:ribosome-associated translation inhibitor RaiA
MGMKRIHVVGDDNAISSQARTYAEYRVFSALTRHALKFRRARVLLRPSEDHGTCDRVACAVSVALEPSGSVRVRMTGPHVYAAINRAVDRLGDVLGGQIEQRRSS